MINVNNETEGDLVFEVLMLADRPYLTHDVQGSLAVLLHKWEKIFSAHEEDFEMTDMVQHCITTDDAAPIRERLLPAPPVPSMRSPLAGMLQNGIIAESSSSWVAPIVMVRKKDGSWCFCVDYRKLNSVTHKDAFPLPRIEETLTSMTRAKLLSTLDLASGYWQVKGDPTYCEKIAFTTPLGLFLSAHPLTCAMLQQNSSAECSSVLLAKY